LIDPNELAIAGGKICLGAWDEIRQVLQDLLKVLCLGDPHQGSKSRAAGVLILGNRDECELVHIDRREVVNRKGLIVAVGDRFVVW